MNSRDLIIGIVIGGIIGYLIAKRFVKEEKEVKREEYIPQHICRW